MRRSTSANARKNGQSLSPKQRSAANLIAGGAKTKVQAFREVYDGSPDSLPESEYRSTYRVINAAVLSQATELIPEPLHPELRDAAQTRRFLLNKLREEVESGGLIGLKAIDMLGRVPRYDLWEERTRAEADRTSDDIAASLEDKVAVLLGLPAAADIVVDVSPIAHGNLQDSARNNPDPQPQSNQQPTLDLDK